MTSPVTTPSLSSYYPIYAAKQVFFLAGTVTAMVALAYSNHIDTLTASVALPTILAAGYLINTYFSDEKAPENQPIIPEKTSATQQTLVDLKTETPHFSHLSYWNIMLHPLSCAESTLGKITAVIASVALIVLSIASLGFIPYCCSDKNEIVSTTPATTSLEGASTSTVQTQNPTNTSLACASTSIIQTQESTKIRSYPGDLQAQKKSSWKVEKSGDLKTLYLTSSTHPGYKFTIRDQKLFDSKAEVIVNAANTHLGGGGGIDGAIHDNGGPQKGGANYLYAKAHKELKKAYGGHDTQDASYPSGFAAMIQSGNLTKNGIDNVIVVAGPQGSPDTTKEGQLYSCYYNSLELLHSQGKTRIAFPAISTGIFGFPKDRAAAISLRAVSDFMDKYPQANLTISIHALPTKGDLKTGLDYYESAVNG